MADGPAPEPEPAGKLELQHVAGIWRAHGWIVPAGVVPGEEQDAPDPVEVVEWFEITARGTGAADDPPVALAGGAVAVAALGEARRRYSSRKSAAEKDEQAAPDEGVAAVSHTPQNGTIGGGPCADPPHHRRRRRRPPARPPPLPPLQAFELKGFSTGESSALLQPGVSLQWSQAFIVEEVGLGGPCQPCAPTAGDEEDEQGKMGPTTTSWSGQLWPAASGSGVAGSRERGLEIRQGLWANEAEGWCGEFVAEQV